MHDVAWRGMWICKDAQKQLARTSLNSPLQKREGTGRVSYIDQIENLNIKTEMLMNEKLPNQV